MTKTDKTLYDSYVESHIKSRKSLPSPSDLLKNSKTFEQHYKRHLPVDKNSKILDFGCGYGIMVWWLQKNGFDNTHGIDISQQQISLGQKLGIKSIAEGDGVDYLQGISEEYDLIILRDVIEHVEKEKLIELLKICHKSLKSGGKLIIQTINGTCPFHGDLLYGDFTHKWAFTKSSISQLISEVGFRKSEVFSWRPSYRGKSIFRFLLWIVAEQILRFVSMAHGGSFFKIMTLNLVSVSEK